MENNLYKNLLSEPYLVGSNVKADKIFIKELKRCVDKTVFKPLTGSE